MSNTLAIAVTTAVIEARIRALLSGAGLSGFSITAKMPAGDDPDVGIYVQAYRVTPNPTLRGLDLPTRRADGSVLRKPRLALDVDYAFCFVGDAGDFGAERLAGLVLTDFHANSYLSPTEINDFLAGLPVDDPLAGADLGDQLERVKLSLTPLSLEDLARVWGLANQSYYALTVGFSASIIILDAEVEPSVSRPVTDPRVQIFAQPGAVLESVESTARALAVVAIDTTAPEPESLVIRGQRLAAPNTWLRIGEQMVAVPNATLAPTEIRLPFTPALGLRSAATSVQVVHQVDADPPNGDWRPISSSNALPLALLPAFDVAAPIANAVAGGFEVRVTVNPTPVSTQQVTLLLDEIGGTAHASSSTWSLSGIDLVFAVTDVSPGEYLLRLRIDGAITIPRPIAGGALGDPAVAIP